ncbi:FAD-dependent monooxygenase [Pseudoalteromonas sp. OOF1S-7]|uniref:FAD-dependent monooxygenase n=1 Tax=Pseudoalteromonas sp. OOF1S-7 TaxID=2917757 RepID=UPI001EF47364|nr:FAD-dependent monooxygenase [Pseudoalteromonas sp. OOF1S-7]MCG7535234.1 FAD-dependent monooxygenase [Pseudoalteromonas sp. OOF1S-7]
MEKKRIAIIGAGVAGMAMALLAKKQGHEVQLFERAAAHTVMGAGVTLWPNAMFVMQQMGLAQQITRAGGTPDSVCQYDRSGNRHNALDIDQLNGLSGYATVTILRRDLIRILGEALRAQGVTVQFATTIALRDIDRLRQTFDLVIGADGRMHSVVRQALFASPRLPCYQGFINVMGISKFRANTLSNIIGDFRYPGERFGIVPVKPDMCFWAGAWRTPIDKSRPPSAWLSELKQRFGGWAAPVQSVLKHAEPESVRPVFVHDLDPLPYWHKDNVVVIGDAAHAALPTSGQGACQALEDAWQLVSLMSHQEELSAVLSAFYRLRVEKTTMALHAGRQLAQQLFFGQGDMSASQSGVSVALLSQLWMQGLSA